MFPQSPFPYELRIKIHKEHFKKLKDIKFSLREIDVSACILHNRGEKKIAEILDIAPKTVNTHIYNIMQKLHCNTRDHIIDFFEKSGKLLYIREYYSCIVVQNLFKTSIEKIKKVNKYKKVTCNLFSFAAPRKSSVILALIKYLSLANIQLVEADINDVSFSPDIKHNIYVLTTESEVVSMERSKKDKNQCNNIILLFDKAIKAELLNVNYINFRIDEDFYYTVFYLLKTIMDNSIIDEIIEEFNEESQSLMEVWTGATRGTPFIKTTERFQTSQFFKSKKLMLLTGVICIFILAPILVKINALFFTSKPLDIALINQDFASYVKHFSSDNITNKGKNQDNYKILDQVTKTVSNISDPKASGYFFSEKATLEEILNCIYVMHAIASQHINYEHNEKKARTILLQAKAFAENYVQRKSAVNINFNKLNAEEIYVEFNVVKDLAEIYTRVIYLLGRTYIYSGEIDNCIKYFKLSQHLGKRLGIFEGYLSSRSGIEVLQRKEIDDYIKEGNYKLAKEKLKISIFIARELVEDGKEYIINYNPHSKIQKIIPKMDIFNRVYYYEQIAKYYARLIWITEDNQENKKCLEEIMKIYLGDSKNKGLLELCKDITQKRYSCVVNSLGDIMLKLYEKKIAFPEFKLALKSRLGLSAKINSTLDLIEDIFNISRLNSRNTDYSKADSYGGLARVYEKKLELVDLKAKQRIKDGIERFKNKRDKINKQLGRKNLQLRAHDI